ncbi:unnamed protein product [Ambrosiozyma monospora]|uniref:Unnamed protein product n=1 Tax=Ambrosiozyma monospora TaxID=43982 RepID=A0ACB5UA74_AMBMO|nr:unnamed protein product [Ambrosiozyma monospora]
MVKQRWNSNGVGGWKFEGSDEYDLGIASILYGLANDIPFGIGITGLFELEDSSMLLLLLFLLSLLSLFLLFLLLLLNPFFKFGLVASLDPFDPVVEEALEISNDNIVT